MSICLYVFVCLSVCIHACMYVCMHARMHACVLVCVYACAHKYLFGGPPQQVLLRPLQRRHLHGFGGRLGLGPMTLGGGPMPLEARVCLSVKMPACLSCRVTACRYMYMCYVMCVGLYVYMLCILVCTYVIACHCMYKCYACLHACMYVCMCAGMYVCI